MEKKSIGAAVILVITLIASLITILEFLAKPFLGDVIRLPLELADKFDATKPGVLLSVVGWLLWFGVLIFLSSLVGSSRWLRETYVKLLGEPSENELLRDVVLGGVFAFIFWLTTLITAAISLFHVSL